MTPILEYHKPTTVDAALALLGRTTPRTRFLAGGTHYRRGLKWPEALIDISELGLDSMVAKGGNWEIGAAATLEAMAGNEALPAELRRAARRQGPRNFRQRSTVGGMIASRDTGALFACLLALQARVTMEPGSRIMPLVSRSQTRLLCCDLITSVVFPATRRVAFAEISRTPADLPILCVAVGADRSLANFSAFATGTDQELIPLAGAAQLLSGAPRADLEMLTAVLPHTAWTDDGRGSAEYRNAMLPLLVRRAADALVGGEA